MSDWKLERYELTELFAEAGGLERMTNRRPGRFSAKRWKRKRWPSLVHRKGYHVIPGWGDFIRYDDSESRIERVSRSHVRMRK